MPQCLDGRAARSPPSCRTGSVAKPRPLMTPRAERRPPARLPRHPHRALYAIAASVSRACESQQQESRRGTGGIARHRHRQVVVEQRRPAKPSAVGSPKGSVAAEEGVDRVPDRATSPLWTSRRPETSTEGEPAAPPSRTTLGGRERDLRQVRRQGEHVRTRAAGR